MSKFIVFSTFFLTSNWAISQIDNSAEVLSIAGEDDTKSYAIYYDYSEFIYEGLHTLNVEFYISKKHRFRTGLGYTARGLWKESEFSHVGIPIGFTYLIGKSNAFLELTIGAMPFYQYKSKIVIDAIPLIEIGFRVEPTNYNVLFRAHIGTTYIGFGMGLRI